MNKLQVAWVAIFTAVLIWSGIGPYDYPTWLLEVAPAIIAAALLWYTRERFPLTRLVYILILIHCIVLMIGGHYTYALVPLGDWVREAFDQTRNNYDKLGHFAQGFVPAMVAREIGRLPDGVHRFEDRLDDGTPVCVAVAISSPPPMTAPTTCPCCCLVVPQAESSRLQVTMPTSVADRKRMETPCPTG